MQSFKAAGDFTFWQKMKSSLKENAVIYGSAGLLFLVFFIYVTAKEGLDM